MSNQAGIRLKPDPKSVKGDLKRLSVFKGKVVAVLNQLDLPINLYAATGQDNYRKPRTGMWEEMLKDYDLLEAGSVDTAASFYVGDAGGRSGVPGTRNDFACSDRYDMGQLICKPSLTLDKELRREPEDCLPYAGRVLPETQPKVIQTRVRSQVISEPGCGILFRH